MQAPLHRHLLAYAPHQAGQSANHILIGVYTKCPGVQYPLDPWVLKALENLEFCVAQKVKLWFEAEQSILPVV